MCSRWVIIVPQCVMSTGLVWNLVMQRGKTLNYISNYDLIFYSVNRRAEFIIAYKC